MAASSSSSHNTPSTPLDKLLQRCTRQFHSQNSNSNTTTTATTTITRQPSRPPDAASAALGRALADHVTALNEGQLLQTLLRGGVPASVSQAMLQSLAHRLWQQHAAAASATQSHNNSRTAALSEYAWLAKWLVALEDAAARNSRHHHHHAAAAATLDACVRAFGVYAYWMQQSLVTSSHHYHHQQPTTTRAFSPDLLALAQLQNTSTKMAVWRTLLQCAMEDAAMVMTTTVTRTSPPPQQRPSKRIMAASSPYLATLLFGGGGSSTSSHDNSSNSSSQQQQQQQQHLTIHILLRYLWMAWTKPDACLDVLDDCVPLLQWTTQALLLYMQCHVHSCDLSTTPREHARLALDAAENWLAELAFLGQATVARFQQELEDDDDDEEDHYGHAAHPKNAQQRQPPARTKDAPTRLLYPALEPWLRGVLQTVLPKLLLHQHNESLVCDTSLLLPALQGVLQALLESVNQSHLPIHDATTLSLATAVLTSTSATTQSGLLELLLMCMPTSRTGRSMLTAVVLILSAQNDGSGGTECLELAAALQAQLAAKATDNNPPPLPTAPSRQTPVLFIELLAHEPESSAAAILDQVTQTADFSNVHLTSQQQVATLLVGVAMIMDDCQERVTKGIHFLTSLLEHYAHLGISLLPVLMDRINATSHKGSAKTLTLYLQFLCGPMVRDPVCAQEIWNLVGVRLAEKATPMTIKLVVLRNYPRLCASNKRLYRRIIESLGSLILSPHVEVRLAVAATLADLAKDDLIRDVSDVIGWIQALLTEKEETGLHSLLVHFAIMSLHYLVLAQELDFDVVIKVLNKRLCNIFDHDAIKKLTPVVQEALVVLLGDGECESSSSDDDEPANPTIKITSPQVRGAIDTLLHLGDWLGQKTSLSSTEERVRINIYRSLSGYSPEALEMDVDTIKNAVASEEAPGAAPSSKSARFHMIRDLALNGIKRPVSKTLEQEASSPIVVFARKVLQLEEEAIGYVIWKKKGRRQEVDAIAEITEQVKPGVLSGLPLPAEVREIAIERSSPGASIALLLVSDGSQLTALRDHGDLAFESNDPLWVIFALQGYLHLAASVLSNTDVNTGIGDILTQVGSWYEVFVSPDTMYLAFATLSIYIPHHQRENESTKPYVEELFIVVLDAYKNQRFHTHEIAKICISVVAVSTLRYGSLDRLEEVIKILEQTVRGYGGEQTFGAYYGLALICQALQKFRKSDVLLPVMDDVTGLIYRICGFLVEELLDCYEECDESLLRFVDCLKNGDATPDLVLSMSDLDSNSISLLMTKSAVARYLFISCAVCLPGLAFINGALHLSALRMMEAFEWGGGKGIALPPMLRSCDEAALFTPEELRQIYSSFGSTFETKITEDKSDLDAEGLDDLFFAHNATKAKSTSHGLRRNLVGNRDLFDEDGCVISLISVFNQIAPLPCLGASYFTSPVEVRRQGIAHSDHESIVEIIREAASESESKYSDMAIILMALLASLRNQGELKVIAESLPKEMPEGPLKLSKDASVLDFDKMPRPQVGTILAGVIDEIELQSNSKSFAALVRHGDLKKVTFSVEDQSLTTAMSVLESITLPGQFVASFLEPLMQLRKVLITERCISLLCSQLRGRRRASFDSREFVALALKIANLPPEEWESYLCKGDALRIFLSTLPHSAPKFPSDGSTIFESIWRNVFAKKNECADLVGVFLSSTKELLSSTSLSPKLTNTLRRLVVGTISEDVLDLPLAALRLKADISTPSLLELYASCLGVLPRASLEESDFFNVNKSFDGFSSDAKKIISMLALMKQNYFARMSEELSIIGSWLVRKFNAPVAESERESLHFIITSFASLSTQESPPVKCARLLKVLEALLTFKASGARLGLQWLAALMAYWCRSEPVDDDLTLGYMYAAASSVPSMADGRLLHNFVENALLDLPGNLAAFAMREKMSSNVANLVHRLFVAWSDLDHIDVDIPECLHKADMTCQRNFGLNEDVIVSLAASNLLASQP